jgi:hypothetical protein
MISEAWHTISVTNSLRWHFFQNTSQPIVLAKLWQGNYIADLKLTPFAFILHYQNQLDALSGRVKLKVEPLPTSLSTQILPPCNSTNFLANVNPRPVPSTLCA